MNEIIETLGSALAISVPLLVGFLCFLWILKSWLIICDPGELVIISGRRHKTSEGLQLGFRVLTHGRTIKIPVVERAEKMDARLISVPIHIKGAYSQGGIPLTVPAIANIKLSSDPEIVANAVERFLGKSREEIARVAQETLEGHLRGVLATMTPEEVNTDRLKFAEQLKDEAEADLTKLGLQLDTFKIQHISDDRNYLESLGRRRIAEIIRDAEMSESDALQIAEKAESEAKARGEVSLIQADMEVKAKENELRQIQAECDAKARAEEERAVESAKAVRMHEEKALQMIRKNVETLRNQADITIPAQIERRALELEAQGNFAHIRENAKAHAEALGSLRKAWDSCKEHAMDIVIAQRMDHLLEQATKIAGKLSVDNINLMDTGDMESIQKLSAARQRSIREVFQELCLTLGLQRNVLAPIENDPKKQSTTQIATLQTERGVA